VVAAQRKNENKKMFARRIQRTSAALRQGLPACSSTTRPVSNALLQRVVHARGSGILPVVTSQLTQWRQQVRFFSDDLGAATAKKVKKGPTHVPISLEASAVKRLTHLEETLKKPVALRLLVQSGGCSGFEYKLSIDEKWDGKNDLLLEQDGVRFVTDEISVTFLQEATIGYVEDMIRSAFQVTNNKVADNACSCGDSFNVAF